MGEDSLDDVVSVRRYDLLHVIRQEARSYFRLEAATFAAEILEAQAAPAKRLLGSLRDRAGVFFHRMSQTLREFALAGILALSGQRLESSDEALDDLLEFHRFKLSQFRRDLLDRGLGTIVTDVTSPPYSPDQFAAQAELYGGAVWPVAINYVRARFVGSVVFSLERRKHIGPDVPCDDCIVQEDLGIVQIGTLDPIGDSECMSSCHCIFIFYIDEDDEQGWIGGRGPLDEQAFGER